MRHECSHTCEIKPRDTTKLLFYKTECFQGDCAALCARPERTRRCRRFGWRAAAIMEEYVKIINYSNLTWQPDLPLLMGNEMSNGFLYCWEDSTTSASAGSKRLLRLLFCSAHAEKKPAAIWPVNLNTRLVVKADKPVSNKQLTSTRTEYLLIWHFE